MKLTKLTYIAAAASVMFLTSCDDYLDTVPDNRVELKTTEHLRKLMNSAYPMGNYAWPCEISSDNIEDNNAPDDDGLRYNLSSYNRGDDEMFAWEPCLSNSANDSPSDIWQRYYLSVANANAVLDRLDQMQEEQGGRLDDKQRALKGEALVLRSYCHFILANVFCQQYAGPERSKSLVGIPYPTKPETTVQPHYERGNLAETYDMIRKDLEEGLPLIANGIYEIPKYHFNTAAANAYAARFYLYTREYEKVIEHANIAFGGADVDVSSSLCNVWNNLGNFYYISDFGKYTQNIDKPWNLLLFATYSQGFRHYVGSQRYHVIRNAACGTIRGAGPTWSKWTWSSTSGKGGRFYMHPCYNGACGVNGQSEYGTYCAATVSEQFEYTDKVAGIGYTHVTRPEFTTDELLLTRAEARLFLGDKAGCLADLQIWERNRANCTNSNSTNEFCDELTDKNLVDFYTGVAASGEAIKKEIVKPINIDQVCPSAHPLTDDMIPYLQCVQHFRRMETVHLGLRWFDIKRYGIEFTRKIGRDRVETLALDDQRRAIEVPSEVIAAGMQPSRQDTGTNPKMSEQPKYVVVR